MAITLQEAKEYLSNTSLYDYVYNTVTVTEEDTENDIMRKIVTGA